MIPHAGGVLGGVSAAPKLPQLLKSIEISVCIPANLFEEIVVVLYILMDGLGLYIYIIVKYADGIDGNETEDMYDKAM